MPGKWTLRYHLEGEEEPTEEEYDAKAQARDRYYMVREFKGMAFVELRKPNGRVWFRDHHLIEGEPDDLS